MTMRMAHLIIIMLAAVLAACAQQETQDSNQLANPASVYCEEQGGTLEILETAAGQQGICVIDGVRCDEWAFYRGECGDGATQECGECPQLMPPAPGFCENGTIVPAEPDSCGCVGAPSCVQQ